MNVLDTEKSMCMPNVNTSSQRNKPKDCSAHEFTELHN